ncbi:hypothetical protein [Pseudomonas sp. BIC9C]|uniref:hypothetical protein n=1 Tax=Pseudomonas sp. BIC9C TaxID=3078458 RepID=UPI002AD4296A|nr:hypothetical protein [Pseudomonas sp. BIC9C]
MPRYSIPTSSVQALSPDTVELLRSVVAAFRKSCDAIHLQNRMPSCMTNFPGGCCGNCSEILGDYLISRGLAQAELVRADKGGKSHAWIEVGNLVIDVTGDQFPGRPSVYVDAADAWFKKWSIDGRRKSIYDFSFRLLGENELRAELHRHLDEHFHLCELPN